LILIADAHVSAAKGNVETFFEMLSRLGQTGEDIVFLGDIFDLWIALPRYEKDIHKRFLEWCDGVRRDRTIGYVEGNHEFFVAEERAERFTWCEPESRLDERANALFVHGDLINRADVSYLRFRKATKHRAMKAFVRRAPLAPTMISCLKGVLDRKKRSLQISLPRKAIDAYAEAMFSTGVRRIFVGHFHNEYRYRGRARQSLHVLPDWYATEKISLYRPGADWLDTFHWRALDERLSRGA